MKIRVTASKVQAGTLQVETEEEFFSVKIGGIERERSN